MDKYSVDSLISIRLQMLISLFGRKITEDQLETMKRVYFESLSNMPASAISSGFSKAEQTCDRFPTPKTMRDLCGDFLHGNVPTYRDAMGEDPETKRPIRIKLDEDGERLYRADDCPEGRNFLQALRTYRRKR